jgi:hypothetical protein
MERNAVPERADRNRGKHIPHGMAEFAGMLTCAHHKVNPRKIEHVQDHSYHIVNPAKIDYKGFVASVDL